MSQNDQKIIFSMAGLNKKLPSSGKVILKNIYLSFFHGAKIGVIGLNGSGKSTLLKIIAGKDTAYQGEVIWSDGISVGMLEQEPDLDESKTVREIVEEGAQEVVDALKEYDDVNAKFAEEMTPEEMDKLIQRQGELTDILDATNAWELDNKLDKAMMALMCPAPEIEIKVLSGGERRRVALCRLLLQEPDVLLLDEPTNHLDALSIDWLEQHLQQYKGTVIAVTHDRYFLDNVAGWILELDRGEGIPFKGNYTSWLEQKSKRLAQEEKQESKRRKTLERELDWVRMTPKARHAKSKSRLTAYEKLAGQGSADRENVLEINIPSGPRLGDQVIEANDLSKAFGNRLLFKDLSFKLDPGAIVGLIGPNGVGKTTIFRILTDRETPDSGSVLIGETVVTAYVDQSHEDLKAEKTLFEAVSGGNELIQVGANEQNARAYLSKFNFSGQDHSKKVGILSGGERNRLHLAMALKEGANVLLLDEPTNDLDVNTLRALEDGLESFAGSAIIISHDRWFLDRVCTHILAYEGEDKFYFFEGGFSEYLEKHKDIARKFWEKKARYHGIG